MRNLLFLFLTMPLVFASCSKDEKETRLSGIEFGENEVTIEYEEELQLSLFPNPKDAKLPECIFFSENEKIVTVSKTGLIKGVGSGNATVSAKTPDGEYYASCDVTVNPKPGLYREPYLKFGGSAADIKKYETREEYTYSGQGENLAFRGENEDVNAVLYIIKSGKMESTGVVFNKTNSITTRVLAFLKERYEYLGIDSDGDYGFLSEDEKVFVYVTVLDDDYLAAIYISVTPSQSPSLRSSVGSKEKKAISDRFKTLLHETERH